MVKAHGYGHGGPAVARAALAGGAGRLAVALVDEGVELREHGVDAPVLLLSECGRDAADTALAYGLTPTLYSAEGSRPSPPRRAGVGHAGGGPRQGRHRHAPGGRGARGPARRSRRPWRAGPALEPRGALDAPAGGRRRGGRGPRLHRGAARPVRPPGGRRWPSRGLPRPVLHAANTAGAIAFPARALRHGALRPRPLRVPARRRRAAAPSTRRPVASSCARPCRSRRGWSPCARSTAGERPSYGRLRPLPARSLVATVPIGYADGVPRALFGAGYEVLIGGRAPARWRAW